MLVMYGSAGRQRTLCGCEVIAWRGYAPPSDKRSEGPRSSLLPAASAERQQTLICVAVITTYG